MDVAGNLLLFMEKMEIKSDYKFSIIIGHYNQWRYLAQLAESLNMQMFRDFEVHICDDGSDPGKKYSSAQGRLYVEFFEKLHPLIQKNTHIHTQSHKGMRLSKNLNQGISDASGEYCVFIMADSFPEHDYLAVMSEWIKPGRILNGVRYQVINKKGVDVDWRLKKQLIPPMSVLLPSKPYDMITGNGLVVPTEAMEKYGPWNEKIKGYGGDDNELVARLYYKGYTVWSIIDAKLFHNWHKPIGDGPGNKSMVNNLIKEYAN